MRLVQRPRLSRRLLLSAAAGAAAVTVAVLAPQQAGALATAAVPVAVVDYDSHDATQYAARWVNPYGPLDGVVPQVDASGAVTLSDVPFKPGTDFSVFDHLKYIGISTQTFTVPKVGTVTFEVDIAASTPGATAGHVVHGVYGPPGPGASPTRRPALHRDGARGPAGGGRAQHDRLLHRPALRLVRLRRVGVPAHRATAHLRDRQHEQPRLPRRHGGRPRQGLHPDHQEHPAHAGPDPPRRDLLLAQRRSVQRRLRTRRAGRRDGHQRRHPARPAGQQVRLDRHLPLVGQGEKLADQINSLSIGHGLFSLLDAFPFQYGCSPATTSPGAGACSPESAAYSVSLSPAERSFGQGAEGVFSGFRVTTTGR